MSKQIKLILYILLNILISAATILLVLWIWEMYHPTPKIEEHGELMQDNAVQTQIQNLQEPVGDENENQENEEVQLSIDGVFGMGNIDLEYVLISNKGDNTVNLQNWQLVSPHGESFIFPSLTLSTGAKARINTKTGTTSPTDLYWGLSNPVWETGDTIIIIDDSGNEIASYITP